MTVLGSFMSSGSTACGDRQSVSAMSRKICERNIQENDRRYRPRLVAIAGVVAAAFLVVAGFALGIDTAPDPFGTIGKAIAVASLALTFGYYLGLATKQKEMGAEAIFYEWFFGSFAVLSGLGSAYAVAISGMNPADLVKSSSFLDVALLLLGTMFGATAIASGLVETGRIRYLRQGFRLFSELVTKVLLFGYVLTRLTNVIAGIFAGGLVLMLLILEEMWRSKQWPFGQNESSGRSTVW